MDYEEADKNALHKALIALRECPKCGCQLKQSYIYDNELICDNCNACYIE